MGPKKEGTKKEVANVASIDDPLNTDSWRCVVVMAVEKSPLDSFILREFMEEANKGLRHEVKPINFDTFVLKILSQFATGEVPFKYVFLLNFSSVFQEAAEFVSRKADIPIPLLVKVVKALLFFLKEESILKIKKKAMGPVDPIKAMADRPANIGGLDSKAKPNAKKEQEASGKGRKIGGNVDGGMKVRPPSISKLETELLKRGEGAKEDQCIDDVPLDGYFDLYVLLTGFYYPDFPVELLKAGVPLHGIICIDTSQSGLKRESITYNKLSKKYSEVRSEGIQNFWNRFLRTLWDSKTSFYFKDTIFQVYVPRKLVLEKETLKEFIYREISFLMYDLSDFKRQLKNYLTHMKLWDVGEEKIQMSEWPTSDLDKLPCECISIPVVLQQIIDCICGEDGKIPNMRTSTSTDTIESFEAELTPSSSSISQSIIAKLGSTTVTPVWSQMIQESNDENLQNIFSKVKNLDVKYNLDERTYFYSSMERFPMDSDSSHASCQIQKNRLSAENMEEALNTKDGVFRSYWRQHKKSREQESGFSVLVDFCLYAVFASRVACPYEVLLSQSVSDKPSFFKKTSSFDLIENLETEIRKPHFTITEGSRSVLRSIPYHLKERSKNFFAFSQYKVVTPEKLRASSAPEFLKPLHLIPNFSFVSELWNADDFVKNFKVEAFECVRDSLKESLLEKVSGFDFIEELSKEKLLFREKKYWDAYNCIDCSYSVLMDSLFYVLHNRKDCDNMHHETFNEGLRTEVGLRDFFDYVLDDEAEWFIKEEESYQNNLKILGKKSSKDDPFNIYTDSYFWLADSIKYQETLKQRTISKKDILNSKQESSKIILINKAQRKEAASELKENQPQAIESVFVALEEPKPFEGYNISDMAVQFSGLKTVYYAEDCSISVQLIERLYMDQNLGVQVNQGGHVLYLYSYVCPVPHLVDPYTCHIILKADMVVAFSRRFIETIEEIEELVESTINVLPKVSVSKGKKIVSDVGSTTTITKSVKQIRKVTEDDTFAYDMSLSLPNGLIVKVVRELVRPCYIKQKFPLMPETNPKEHSRLFLPNGCVVKMLLDNTVQVLKANTSTVTTKLGGVTDEDSSKSQEGSDKVFDFLDYEEITSEGCHNIVLGGKPVSTSRFQIFQNQDVETNTKYFRRRDGTYYMIESDGRMSVRFKDSTKMSTSVFMVDEASRCSLAGEEFEGEEETLGEFDVDTEYVFVHYEIIVEHTNYATVVFNSQTQNWKVYLPFDASITVYPEGTYLVNADEMTEVKINKTLIEMNRYGDDSQGQCTMTADLTVFDNENGAGIYCQMEDSTGKVFVLESNANCYILQDEHSSQEFEKVEGEKLVSQTVVENSQSRVIAPQDLTNESSCIKPEDIEKKLTTDNKYFVVRRDITGFEILHRSEVQKYLMEAEKKSLVFTQELPQTGGLRCFVVIIPGLETNRGKWEVESRIADPKYHPSGTKANTSSTYGCPPSWMHPFPKRRKKFTMPEVLSCRVFVETRNTDFMPPTGSLLCGFCEMTEEVKVNLTNIQPGLKNIQEYLKQVSSDNQDILREMYGLAAQNILNEKKKLKPVNTEKLQRYLELSRYYVDLQEYHKHSIRYQIVPNYFHHPAGMSWLILNGLVGALVLRDKKKSTQTPLNFPSPPISLSTSAFSFEELEYNISHRSNDSYSDLSCRTELSMKTAPAVLSTQGVCRCKVKDARETESAPFVALKDSAPADEVAEEVRFGSCVLRPEDLCLEERQEPESKEYLALEDLMALGLV